MLLSLKMSFRVMCFLLAIDLIGMQILRYTENNDASVMSYKRFNENGQNKYPIFTFCFANDPKLIYDDALKELYPSKNQNTGHIKQEFARLLRGSNNPMTYQQEILDSISNVETTTLINHLHKFIFKLSFQTENRSESRKYQRTLNLTKDTMGLMPFIYLSHHDPDQICFSRHSESINHSDLKREKDEVLFDLKQVIDFQELDKTFWTNGNSMEQWKHGYFRTYVHYPGQLIRNLDKPTYELAVKDMLTSDGIQVSLTVSFVSILRKRPNANRRCNATLIDDDSAFRIKVAEKIGCIPLYWKSMIQNRTKLNTCKNLEQHQRIYSLIENTASFIKSYDPPCIEMMVPINVQEGKLKQLARGFLYLTIPYATEMFQEIQNVNDFDVQTLWSSAGGFVGIFLGYSLLQIPDLFDFDWKGYWKKFLLTLFAKSHGGLMALYVWKRYMFKLLLCEL